MRDISAIVFAFVAIIVLFFFLWLRYPLNSVGVLAVSAVSFGLVAWQLRRLIR
jgi:hypothetical protein